jgi:hypothetical protein
VLQPLERDEIAQLFVQL